MKTARLLERELPCLGSNAAYILASLLANYDRLHISGFKVAAYVVIVEKQHEQKTKRHGHEDPFCMEIPERNHPAPGLCWIESLGDR